MTHGSLLQPSPVKGASQFRGHALQVLRLATVPFHTQLDAHAAMRRLQEPDCSAADLKLALLSLQRPVQLIEQALDAHGCDLSQALGVPTQPWSDWLREDLHQLGSVEVSPVPELSMRPSGLATGMIDCLGLQYVMMGSTFGATFLADQLARSGDERVRASRYFQLVGSLRIHFQGWSHTLNGLLYSQHELDCMAKAACRAFSLFIDALPERP